MKHNFTEAQLADILNDLKILRGMPPHDSWSNVCYGDGYFARSLETKYGADISSLEKVVGWAKRVKRYAAKKKKIDESF